MAGPIARTPDLGCAGIPDSGRDDRAHFYPELEIIGLPTDIDLDTGLHCHQPVRGGVLPAAGVLNPDAPPGIPGG